MVLQFCYGALYLLLTVCFVVEASHTHEPNPRLDPRGIISTSHCLSKLLSDPGRYARVATAAVFKDESDGAKEEEIVIVPCREMQKDEIDTRIQAIVTHNKLVKTGVGIINFESSSSLDVNVSKQVCGNLKFIGIHLEFKGRGSVKYSCIGNEKCTRMWILSCNIQSYNVQARFEWMDVCLLCLGVILLLMMGYLACCKNTTTSNTKQTKPKQPSRLTPPQTQVPSTPKMCSTSRSTAQIPPPLPPPICRVRPALPPIPPPIRKGWVTGTPTYVQANRNIYHSVDMAACFKADRGQTNGCQGDGGRESDRDSINSLYNVLIVRK